MRKTKKWKDLVKENTVYHNLSNHLNEKQSHKTKNVPIKKKKKLQQKIELPADDKRNAGGEL